MVAAGTRSPAGRIVAAQRVPEDLAALDIGPETATAFTDGIVQARTVFWNGTMGVFESEPFSLGTLAIARAIGGTRGALTIVAGADCAAAVARAQVGPRIDHITTAGVAALALIEGRKLPGLAALELTTPLTAEHDRETACPRPPLTTAPARSSAATGSCSAPWPNRSAWPPGCADATASVTDADVAVAPGFVALATVAERLRGSRLGVAAQDCYWETKGAFTGEVAVQQIADAGARYVIVGHSERRQFFGETDETVARKTQAALAGRPDPHRVHRRDPGRTRWRQDARTGGQPVRRGAGRAWSPPSWPAWSSPTSRCGPSAPGATPPPPRPSRCIASSAGGCRSGWTPAAARAVRILYGGSVKPDNIAALMTDADIDGALVGGASLTVDSFAKIVKEGTRACTGH